MRGKPRNGRRKSPSFTGQGGGIKFLRGLLENAPPHCVTWPLFRDANGYGKIGYCGKQHWAHRLMCTRANGEPPSPHHEAAHSCGNGDQGCVNPRHLSWQTKTRNQLDRRQHGTKNNPYWGKDGKLSREEVIQIRALKGATTQAKIAQMFSITDATVRDIFRRRTWVDIP